MNIFRIAFLFVLALASASAQIELLPGRLPINEAIRWELAMGSIPNDTSLYHQPPDYYSQPLTFKRTSGRFKPYPMVCYYFSRVDSLPFRIIYRWDAYGQFCREQLHDSSKHVIEPMSRLAEYDAEYEALRTEIIRRYGKPPSGSDSVARLSTDRKEICYWGRSDEWEWEGMTIWMYMIFADSTAPGKYEIEIDQKWP
jgi:hypothetical protein